VSDQKRRPGRLVGGLKGQLKTILTPEQLETWSKGQEAQMKAQQEMIQKQQTKLQAAAGPNKAEGRKFLEENNVQIESWGPFAEGKNDMFKNELLVSIGKKHNKSVAQVILRWLTQRGVVSIPKSVRKERILENINIFDFELTHNEMNTINVLDTQKSLFFDHRDPAIVKWLGSRK